LDEIEKAHPDVFNILLQILDDGRITDNQGVTVNFTNTLIIMTSNLGSHYAFESDLLAREEHYLQEVKRTFKPEFVNRIDEIVVYNALTRDALSQIADKFIGELRQRLAQQAIGLDISLSAKQKIVAEGSDPEYGARPMKRFIQRHLETEIARLILSIANPQDKTILVDTEGSEFTIAFKQSMN
jgi:ATP-dependent Clp protease ATP-binding subunit ClpB